MGMLYYLPCMTDGHNLLAKMLGLKITASEMNTLHQEQQRTLRTSGAICYPREPTAQFQDNYKLKHNCLSPAH